jgi:hypothetical protein
MHLSVSIERSLDEPKSGPISVGWILEDEKAGVIYFEPERVRMNPPNKKNAKSASRCPAVVAMESRYFLIKCPFDLHLGFDRDENGRPHLINRAGPSSGIRKSALQKVVALTNEDEWRFPDRPTIQLILPYVFVADELVYMTQLSPFMHYSSEPLPGTIFGGRFPIDVWPRTLMWAFEWREPKKDLKLKRGDPLFYCMFEGDRPDRAIQIMRAEKTPELQSYLKHISATANFINQTFQLFKEAEKIRPETLLKPLKSRSDSPERRRG